MRLIPLVLTDDLTHLALLGTWDLWAQKQVGAHLSRLLHGRGCPAVVDLSGVDLLTSSGLEALLESATALRLANARLVLLSPRPFVEQTIRTAGLADTLPVVHALDEALAAVGAEPLRAPAAR